MHSVTLRNLAEMSESRPPGYIEEVKSKGTVTDCCVELSDDAYAELVAKYSHYNRVIIPKMKFTQPGTLLGKIIHQITGQVTSACGTCSQHARQMNTWGWLGCWKNRNTILEWMCVEVEKLGHPVDRNVILSLMKAAILEMLQKKPSV
jgi:hypothetical protein